MWKAEKGDQKMIELPDNRTYINPAVRAVIEAGLVNLEVSVGYGPSYGLSNKSYDSLPVRVEGYEAQIVALPWVRQHVGPVNVSFWAYPVGIEGPQAGEAIEKAREVLKHREQDLKRRRENAVAGLKGLEKDYRGWRLKNASTWYLDFNGEAPCGLSLRSSPLHFVPDWPELRDWLAGGEVEPLLKRLRVR